MGLGFESSRAMDFLSSLSPNINVVEIVMEARVLVCTKEPFSFYPNVTEKESQASMQSSEKRALDIQKISISLANDFCTLCMLCHNMKYSFLLVTIALLLPTVKWVQNEQNTLHRVIQ